jgi:probable rRNA maturation factor
MATAKKAVPKPAAPVLSLSVQYACNDDALPSRPQVRRWVKKALEGDSAEVTVRFVDAEEGQMLNREYRHKDYATNVLSFPYAPNPEMAGDLVLCLPVVLKEAAEQKKPAEAHFAHLIVHGMLHLQGYDHETGDEDAEIMEAREREILAALGYPDPYLSEREPRA